MPAWKTRRVALRGPDGKVKHYLRVPDKSDPAFQAENEAGFARLDALLDEAARQAGLTREELVAELIRE